MVIICQIVIISNLTLVAIVIALFVFASSIYKGALKMAMNEVREALENRREFMKERRKGIVEELNKAGEDELVAKLKESLKELDVKTDEINQSISKSIDRVNRLSLKSMVAIPGYFIVLSVVGAGTAVFLSGSWQVVVWIASVAFLIVGIVTVYRNLQAMEEISSIIDLSTLMEQALDTHAKKTSPILFLDLWDKSLHEEGILEVGRGETTEIKCDISLIQGTIGRKARVMFTATEELEFIDSETIEETSTSYKGMTNPKRIIMQYGDINPKEYEDSSINIKAPEETGEYIMSYVVQCEGFTADETFFKIVVV